MSIEGFEPKKKDIDTNAITEKCYFMKMKLLCTLSFVLTSS